MLVEGLGLNFVLAVPISCWVQSFEISKGIRIQGEGFRVQHERAVVWVKVQGNILGFRDSCIRP